MIRCMTWQYYLYDASTPLKVVFGHKLWAFAEIYLYLFAEIPNTLKERPRKVFNFFRVWGGAIILSLVLGQ